MHLNRIEITNFRCLRAVTIGCGPLTALIGANGTGKSSVIKALEFFFGRELDDLDCSGGDREHPVRVAITIDRLPPEREQQLRPWLDETGQLRLERVAEPREDGRWAFRYESVRRQLPAFQAVRRVQGAVPLRRAYNELRSDPELAELPNAASQTVALAAMAAWEAAHPAQCVPAVDTTLTLGGGGEFDLSDLVELVVVPAVRDAALDAAEGRTGGFRQLVDLLVRTRLDVRAELDALRMELDTRYRKIIDTRGDEILRDTARVISERLGVLAPGTAVRLRWELPSFALDPPKVCAEIIEAEFAAEVGRQGHGVQRAYMLALLQALADARTAADTTTGRPLLLLAIEEPELYQHPVRARYLAGVLDQLTHDPAGPATQVLYATHSPFFVSVDAVESLRLLRIASGGDGVPHSTVASVDLDAAASALWTAHGSQGSEWTAASLRPRLRPMIETPISEGFFAAAVVLVEGEEDRAILTAATAARDVALSQRGVAILPVGGKTNLDRAIVVFQQLRIPSYVLFDADRSNGQDGNRKCNRALLTLLQQPPHDMPDTQVNLTFACFADTLADTIRAELGQAHVGAALDRACAQFGFGPDRWKNSVVLREALDDLNNQGRRSATLDAIIDQIQALA